MEEIPCSNVGHIYRHFDRFAVDPLLKSGQIGPILDRNDLRVAEVSVECAYTLGDLLCVVNNFYLNAASFSH